MRFALSSVSVQTFLVKRPPHTLRDFPSIQRANLEGSSHRLVREYSFPLPVASRITASRSANFFSRINKVSSSLPPTTPSQRGTGSKMCQPFPQSSGLVPWYNADSGDEKKAPGKGPRPSGTMDLAAIRSTGRVLARGAGDAANK